MIRSLTVVLVAGIVAGCSGQNMSFNRLQFSAETVPFPDHYQAEAARVVAKRGGDLPNTQVSYPREVLGASAFGPRRWYSCIRGLPGPTPVAGRLLNVEDTIGIWTGHHTRVFDIVLFYSSEGRASVQSGFDSPLCRDAAFEAITAEPPLT